MKIAILDCVTPDRLTAKYGPTGNHVARWLAPILQEATFKTVHVASGLPAPAPGDVDGIVISGSEKGVYDDTLWMQPLRCSIQAYREGGTPVFGICFGHQIMADVWGGKAEKVDKGFITGVRAYELNGKQTNAYAAHQDQITKLPPNATVTGSASYCPIAALSYDFPAMSVQFHPEYNKDFTADLIDMYGNELLSNADMEVARQSLDIKVPENLYGTEVAAFFRTNYNRITTTIGHTP